MPLKKIIQQVSDQRAHERRQEFKHNLKRHEARLGGTLFGPVPKGHRREFFCLDEHTWVWYEEWKDAAGRKRSLTTRYDIRPNGVLKFQDGYPSSYITAEEGRNLYQAVRQYNQKLDNEFARFL